MVVCKPLNLGKPREGPALRIAKRGLPGLDEMLWGLENSRVNIGAGLAKLGKKVLLIDLDPQAHLTYSLGIQAHELDKTVYELLKGEG